MWAIASHGLTTGNKQLAVTFRPAEANDNIDFRDWQGHLILVITQVLVIVQLSPAARTVLRTNRLG